METKEFSSSERGDGNRKRRKKRDGTTVLLPVLSEILGLDLLRCVSCSSCGCRFCMCGHMFDDFLSNRFVQLDKEVVVVPRVGHDSGVGHTSAVRGECGKGHTAVARAIQLTPKNQGRDG